MRRSGFTLVEAVIVFAVLTAVWVVALPTLAGERVGISGKVKCGNNLRRLAIAAIQYADERRFFPHVRGFREVDGGMDTPDTPRKVRLLVQLGYHDQPDEFVCPSSDDSPATRTQEPARWSWRGGEAPAGEPIGATTPGLDPTLLETTELSYGWSQRLVNSNVKTTFALAGDRASRKADGYSPGLAGNHVGGLNVVDTGGYVRWLAASEPDAATIGFVGSAPSHWSWLSVESPVEAPGVREPLRLHVQDGRALVWLAAPPIGLAVLLLAGVLLARRTRADPGPAG